MRSVGWLGLFLLLAGAAVTLAPSAPEAARHATLPAPPPLALMHVASLGRAHVAADVLWLRAIQFIGSPHSEAAQYEGLGPWLGRVTELSPRFEMPYYAGGILLSTVPDQVDDAAALLARAEESLAPARCRAPTSCPAPDGDIDPDTASEVCAPCPELEACNDEVPLWRGFVSYFGELDPRTAARHYCEARRRGGPPYLDRFVVRLARQVDSCRALRAGLAEVLAQGGGDERTQMLNRSGQLRIVVHCEENALRQAAGAFRLRFGRNPANVAEMVNAGLLEQPFAPEGQCWGLGESGWTLSPCGPLLP